MSQGWESGFLLSGPGGRALTALEAARVQEARVPQLDRQLRSALEVRRKVTLAYLLHAALIDGEVLLRLLRGPDPAAADGAALRRLQAALPSAYASCVRALRERVDAARHAAGEAHAAVAGPVAFGLVLGARDSAHEYHQATLYRGRVTTPLLVPADRKHADTAKGALLQASRTCGLQGCSRPLDAAGALPPTLYHAVDSAEGARLDVTACGMPMEVLRVPDSHVHSQPGPEDIYTITVTLPTPLASVPVITQPVPLRTLVDEALAACGAGADDDATTSALRQALTLLVGLESSDTAVDILRPGGMDVTGASDIDRLYGTPPGAAGVHAIAYACAHEQSCAAAVATGACSCGVRTKAMSIAVDFVLSPLITDVSVDGARGLNVGSVELQRGRLVLVPARAGQPIVDASPPSSDEEGGTGTGKVRGGGARTTFSLAAPLDMPGPDRSPSRLQSAEADLWSMLEWEEEARAESVAVHLSLTAVHLGVDPSAAGVSAAMLDPQFQDRAAQRRRDIKPPLSPSELPVPPCDVFLLTCQPMANELSQVLRGLESEEADGRAPLQGAFGLRSDPALLRSSRRGAWREDAEAVAAVARILGLQAHIGPALLRRLLRLTALTHALSAQLETEAAALRSAFRLDGGSPPSLRLPADGALAALAAEVDAHDGGDCYSALVARGQETACKLTALLEEVRKAAGVASKAKEVAAARAAVLGALDGREAFLPRRPAEKQTVLSLDGGDDFQQPGSVRPAAALDAAVRTLAALTGTWARPRRAVLAWGAGARRREVHGAACLTATRLYVLVRVSALYEWLRGAVVLPASPALRALCAARILALRTCFTGVTVLEPHRAQGALTSLARLHALMEEDTKSRAELRTRERVNAIISRLDGVADAEAAGGASALFDAYLHLQTLDADAYSLGGGLLAAGGGPAGGSPPAPLLPAAIRRASGMGQGQEGEGEGEERRTWSAVNLEAAFAEVEGASHADMTPDGTPPRPLFPRLEADPFDLVNVLAAGTPSLPRAARLIADHEGRRVPVRFGASASELEGSDDRSALEEEGSGSGGSGGEEGGGGAPAEAAPLPPLDTRPRAPLSPWAAALFATGALKKGSGSSTPATTGSRSPPAPTTSHVTRPAVPPLPAGEGAPLTPPPPGDNTEAA